MVQEQPEVERLRSENERLRWALAQAGIDADMAATERAGDNARRSADLAISRAEASAARGQTRRIRSEALVAEQRHNDQVEVMASALATSQALVVALRVQDRRQAALIEMGERLRDADDVESIVCIGTEIAAQAVDALRAAYGVVDVVAETVLIGSDWCAPGVPSIAGLYRFRDFGAYIDDLKRGETVAIDDTLADPRTSASAEVFAAMGISSLINVPLIERGRLAAIAIMQHDGLHSWTVEEIAFVTATADRIRAAIALREAEARQAMLNGEIAHRLKNTLAIVQAIVAQTLRRAPSVADARKVLSDRLMALGKAHDALMSGRTDATTVQAVVASTLTLHSGHGGRVVAEGSDVEVGPSAALSLALMLHELATNAAKYGALSTAMGRVDLVWSVEPGPGGDALLLVWTERGGPPVSAPTRRGFGSQLIERGFGAGAVVSLDFDPSGVVANLRAPLSAFQSGIAAR